MKKILMVIASLLMCAGMVSSARARDAKAPTARAAPSKATVPTTNAPPEVNASTRAADLSKLGKSKRPNARQLKALGLKPLSRQQGARIEQLLKKSNGAKTSAVGTNYWYTWQNARNSWSDAYYSGPYYSYPWYPYYVIYDNWKTCTYSGTYCIDAHAYTYQYYLYYYPNGTWYYYNTGGYGSNSTDHSGFGPNAS